MTDTDQAKHADAAAKAQTDAEKKRADETKKKLADERKAREDRSNKAAKAAGDIKPTPTQEENDLAASGVHVAEHEDDGSEPDPNTPAPDALGHTTKQVEANKTKPGYTTRQTAT